jgi:hypothetical protein
VDDRKLIRLGKEKTSLFAEFPELYAKDPYMSDHLRHLTVGLDLKQDYDILREMDLSGCELTEKASVDVMLVDDRIRFLGWSLIDGEDHMEELERYLVFEDPFGKTYGARVLPQSRKDLVSHFGREEYEYAGFEGVLSKKELRIDILPYRAGVLTVDRAGKKFLCWSRDTDVIRRTVELGLVSMPGALTPSEVMTAHKAGADYVKLFPIGLMGVEYVKAIMAPISHVKMLAVGNISSDNAADYLKTGVLGVGVGGKLVNKNAIATGDFDALTKAAQELISAVKSV